MVSGLWSVTGILSGVSRCLFMLPQGSVTQRLSASASSLYKLETTAEGEPSGLVLPASRIVLLPKKLLCTKF